MRYHYYIPIGLAKIKIVIILITDKDTKKPGQLSTAGENEKWYIHTGKIDQLLLITPNIYLESSKCTCGHLSQRTENLCLHKSFYINGHSTFICNVPKLETTQISFSGWMVKWTVLHSWHGIILIKRTNYWYTQQLGWISRKLCYVEKKTILKSHIACNSIYITFLK